MYHPPLRLRWRLPSQPLTIVPPPQHRRPRIPRNTLRNTNYASRLSQKQIESDSEWLPGDEDEEMDDDHSLQEDEDDSDNLLEGSDLGSVESSIGELSEANFEEEEMGARAAGAQEEEGDEIEEEDDPVEHQEHLQEIQQALAPNVEKPNSGTSASTTYSEDIMREVRKRESAEAGLLDLGRVGLTLNATEEQFEEYEKKLMTLQRQFAAWHRDSLAHDNERIDIVIRAAKEHAAAWVRRNGRGGGGGEGRDNTRLNHEPLDEDEEEEYQALIDTARLNMEQRIELIDDLERCPALPPLHELNLVEALVAIDARCQWLSTYFRLISIGRSVAWLQMRGPLASNLINLWTWKLEYDVAVKIDYINEVNVVFGKTWCILELLRKVENGEEGSPAQRYTVDLYSTKFIRRLKSLLRPRPKFHSAGLPRVSAWMTNTRFHLADTLNHRNLYDSPPTHFFAAFILDVMSYATKWHLENDIEDWPIPMLGLPEALLTELKYVVANVQRPADPFNDEDLADPQAGGRKTTAEEVWEGILLHTAHILVHHDKQLQKVHERHRGGRKSRRTPVGNMNPETLRAPPPNLEVDYIPPIDECRQAGSVLIDKVLNHPFWTLFGPFMCYRCRNREAVPRQGIHRCCYGADGAACVECQDSNQKCLMRLPGARIKNISSKDWRHKRPKKGVITGHEIGEALDNTWYNGKASEDQEPPEVWEELRDEYWLDMAKLESEEKKKKKAAKRRLEAEQPAQQANKGKKRKRVDEDADAED
ncbi:hypothetical protein CALCODRAFT_510241 [Calocera cornea HHB12733]|uniref:Putative Zn2Cys6 domain-containing protein n=1 Tax=Calocera cornea HHB12733 TaxID=1353952 RepID=A0A165EPL0_9BASI|nr:hypothetical protein CALCODRAFT_510241 [Calocera cornea HHB12733]